MNREALEYLFEEEMETVWIDLRDRDDLETDGYALMKNGLSQDELAEISACGAGIKNPSLRPHYCFIVFDDE